MGEFIEILSDLFKNGGPGTYIATGALALMIFSVLIQAFSGFRKGYPRQTAKTVATLAAAVIAFIIVNVMCSKVFGIFDDMTVAELLTQIESYGLFEIPQDTKDIIFEINPLVIEYILAMLFSPVIAPLTFMILFIVLNIIFRFIYHIVKWCFHIKKKKGKKNRLIGALIGAVHGFIFAAIIILPITVFADITNVVIEAQIETTGDNELEQLYEDDIKKTTDAGIFKTVKVLGGNAVLNAFGNVKNDDTKFNAREEFYLLLKGALVNADTLGNMDMENMTQKDKDAINDILDMIEDSDFLSTVLAEVLNLVADEINKEADFRGEDTEAIITAIINILETSTKDTVAGDLRSMTEILFLLSDSGIMDMSGSDDPGDFFTKKDANGETVIKKILNIIDSNPRFASLETALVETSIAMLTEGTPVSAESYQNIKTDFKDIISIAKPNPADTVAYDAYLDDVASAINDTLVEEGIELEADIIDTMAEYVAENYGGTTTELSDDEFNDIMLNYYDAYLEYIESENGDAAIQ